jgi:hypothetical protein
MGKWRCSSTNSYLRHQMVVSGQLHASATLVGLMDSPVAIKQESQCASETLWMVWRKVSLSVMRFLGRPAPGLVTILNTIIRRLLLHFCLAIISRPRKTRKACLTNCAPRLAVGLISLTLRSWDGKLRFVRILSHSTKMLR